MQSSPAEEEGTGGWGLSSVSAAFSGWGLATTAEEPVTSEDGDLTAATTASTTTFQDDEWRRQTREVEDAASSAAGQVMSSVQEVEDTLDETAKMAAAAASSFFSGASNFLSGGDDAAGAAELDAAAAADAASNEGDVDNLDGGGHLEDPGILQSILDLNPLNNIASQWVNDLERQSNANDPHSTLRHHLDAHLKDWPNATYEEWVEESLVALEKWDRGSAVVDDTFYSEGNAHRNLWNQRMVAEEKRCVPGRKSHSVTTSDAPSAAPSGTLPMASSESMAVSKASKETPTASAVAEPSTVTQAAAALLNDDADLDGLLGDDDEDGEICFVSPPSSGGL